MSVFNTLRFRFAALLFVAVIPLVAMGAAIAVHNANLLSEHGFKSVRAVRDTLALRQLGFLREGERLLQALSLGSSVLRAGPVPCSDGLSRILSVAGGRYASLVAVDAKARVLCNVMLPGRSDALNAEAFATAQTAAIKSALAKPGLQIGALAISGSGTATATLPLALGITGFDRSEGAASGAVSISLDQGRLVATPDGERQVSDLAIWLVQDAGTPVPLGAAPDADFPASADMSVLASAANHIACGHGMNGRAYLYGLADLPGGLRIVVGLPEAGPGSDADQVLGQRLVELGLVLLLALAIVAFGADISIGRPLKRLGGAVARWRAGGKFDTQRLFYAPAEIVGLAHSFTEATAALGVREQQLRDAGAKQELLMQEIHHRVKNNLQVVASLLNLQASRIRQPAAKAEFHAARDRIRALATLHRHLYAHGELHTINMRGFLEELCEQLLQAMGETPAGGRIALTIEAPELQISSDQAVPMALLVTEAVSNAVKYAFPGGRSGHIAVRLTLTRDTEGRDLARLTIDDDGVGIPAGRSETESGVRDGLGLRLMNGFARQLGSTLELREEHGTHYAVNIVLHRERDLDAAQPSATELEGEHA